MGLFFILDKIRSTRFDLQDQSSAHYTIGLFEKF